MRIPRLSFLLCLLLLPAFSSAQEQGNLSVNMGRGLDSGMSLGWAFRENWTLRPTIGLGYSNQDGLMASLGGTILRSIGVSHRVYGYVGAGVYYSTINNGVYTNVGGRPQPGTTTGSSVVYNTSDLSYITAPVGLRARVYGNFELFAEAAYQKALSGQFAPDQIGQFSGDANQRYGATFGLTMRLN